VKLRIDAILGAIIETAKITAARVNITLNCAGIPFPFSLNIIERTPIIKKRFAIPNSNRLIQLAAVKTWGAANIADADAPPAGNVNSAKASLRVLINDVSSEVCPKAYHERVITKRSKTIKVLSVLSNLSFTFEMMKTRITVAR
jgi:hypothetical protein